MSTAGVSQSLYTPTSTSYSTVSQFGGNNLMTTGASIPFICTPSGFRGPYKKGKYLFEENISKAATQKILQNKMTLVKSIIKLLEELPLGEPMEFRITREE